MVTSPTYTFEEVIEQIRTAESHQLLNIISMVAKDDKDKYSLFDYRVINIAIGIAEELIYSRR